MRYCAIRFYFGALVVTALCSSASAALLRYEPFDYPVGALVEGQTNPDGETWLTAYASTAPTYPVVVAGNLSAQPIPDPVGNSAEIDGNGSGAGKAIRLPLGQTIASGDVYYSMALRVDALTGSNNLNGGFFVGFNNTDTATTNNPGAAGARLQARIDPVDPTKYNLGIFNNRNAMAASTSWSPLQLDVGTTYFVVASHELIPGASNDLSRLWINPTAVGPQPLPSAIDTTPSGSDLSEAGGVRSIILRQSPAPHVTIDEIRVGHTWTDVIPEPTSLALVLTGLALAPWRRRIG
jgi:hypothetical protein